MSDNGNNHLQTIAKSSILIFFGTLINLSIGFLCRIILVRLTSQEEYGIYALSLTVVTICITLSTLGLQEGLTRHIVYLKGKKSLEIIPSIIVSSIASAFIASLFIFAIIFMTADYITINMFNSFEMSQVLKLLSLTIPFSVVTNILIAVFRAFNIATIRVVFQDILKPLSYLTFLGIVAILQRSFLDAVYSYVISIIFTCFLLSWFFLKKTPVAVKWRQISLNYDTKELLKYSFPLLAVGILLNIMTWTDTLMLGYFETPEVVASYNAAQPIASLLSIVINSIGFLYVPIASHLYSTNQIKELGIINSSSTKWCFILTFPIFILIFLFPEFILNLFYDFRYSNASTVLQVLTFGFIMNSYFGLNYYTLLSAGKSSFIMHCSLISASLNVFLNLILIPYYGMLGAAIASASSFIVVESYMTLKLYKLLKIHSFTINYSKLTFLTFIVTLSFYSFRNMFVPTFCAVLVFYLVLISVYFLFIYYAKILDEEDIMILTKIKTKIVTKYVH